MQEVLSLAPSDSELEGRARSILRWKIRFNALHVAVESGHVTLSGQVISAWDRETAEQTIRRLRGVVGITNCIIASPADRRCANGDKTIINRSHKSDLTFDGETSTVVDLLSR